MQVPAKFWNYAIAVALVATSTAVRLILSMLEDKILFFGPYYPAILVAAMWGGVGPGVVAAILTLLVVWFSFIPPYFSFAILDRAQIINLILFSISAGLIVWIANRYRNAMAKIEEGEQTRKLLVEEMQHRSRNALSVAKSVVDQTLKNHPDIAQNFSRASACSSTR